MEKSLTKEYGWTTLDIVMVAVIGVVFSLLYWAYNLLYAFLVPFLSASPVTAQAFVGFWFIAGIVSAYIIQKPGAGFLGEVIAAIISMFLGSIWGVWVLISGLVQGAATEAIFAAYKWKKFNYLTLILSGIFTGIVSFFFPESLTEGYFSYKPLIIVAMIVVRLASSVVLASILGKAITDGVVKTGVLRNFKIGKNKT
ncbi:MAG: ECF transporter S component [Actinobacteria bacterium]|nr:ECF transporter S component [Actinomycetota bacterium]